MQINHEVMIMVQIKPQVAELFLDFARYSKPALALSKEQRRDMYENRRGVSAEEFGHENAERFAYQLETVAL
ncbi:MAG: hypothetical protein Cons2KO_19070 [Congregibacter sp.]